eukprot:3003119-Rhodomonas_salina.1
MSRAKRPWLRCILTRCGASTQEYHRDRKDAHRNICLIPRAAHGTNPATAAMYLPSHNPDAALSCHGVLRLLRGPGGDVRLRDRCGMDVVPIECDDAGNTDMKDLAEKIEEHKDNLGALMITYPSTHGVFEDTIVEICKVLPLLPLLLSRNEQWAMSVADVSMQCLNVCVLR